MEPVDSSIIVEKQSGEDFQEKHIDLEEICGTDSMADFSFGESPQNTHNEDEVHTDIAVMPIGDAQMEHEASSKVSHILASCLMPLLEEASQAVSTFRESIAELGEKMEEEREAAKRKRIEFIEIKNKTWKLLQPMLPDAHAVVVRSSRAGKCHNSNENSMFNEYQNSFRDDSQDFQVEGHYDEIEHRESSQNESINLRNENCEQLLPPPSSRPVFGSKKIEITECEGEHRAEGFDTDIGD